MALVHSWVHFLEVNLIEYSFVGMGFLILIRSVFFWLL